MAATATITCGGYQLRRVIPAANQPFSVNTGCVIGIVRSRKHGVLVGRRMEVTVASRIDDRVELDDNPEGIISGEWPENFSLLCYEDLRSYLEPQIFKDKVSTSDLLEGVMTTTTRVAMADQTLEEIHHHFEVVSGLPVVDYELRCVGLLSRDNVDRALYGLKTKVAEVMTSPPATLSSKKTVLDAAALMLKLKIYSIAIVDEEQQVIGIVNYDDIFQEAEFVEA